MKLSISNIAWSKGYDEEMYSYLKSNGIEGIEIAPTRIFENNPYDELIKADEYYQYINEKYCLEVSSIQSIWFGKSQNMFDSEEERMELLDYTKRAIEFASEIKCNNLVFGCPKNRNVNNESCDIEEIALEFFRELGSYAIEKGTVLAIEPNPSIYGTNFINSTEEAFDIVKKINNKGILVNVDLGTIINNEESLDILTENIHLINHIHISEPYLEKIQKRDIHKQLARILKDNLYDKYVSIEMKNLNDLDRVKETLSYIIGIFK